MKNQFLSKFKKAVIVSFAFALLTTTSYAQSGANDDSKASLNQVKKAALFQIKFEQKTNPNSPWSGHSIKMENPIPVYDTTHTVDSYIVNLTTNDKPCGYVEIGSNKDEYPVLSFSLNASKMDDKKVVQLKDKRKNKNGKVKSEKVIKISSGVFGLKEDYSDDSAEIISSDESFSQIISKENNIATKLRKVEYKKDSRDFWDKIDKEVFFGDIGTNTDGVTDDLRFETGTRSQYLISGVPDNNQIYYPPFKSTSPWYGYSGCTVTAAANVMHYIGAGKSTLNNTIVELRKSMGTLWVPYYNTGVTNSDNIVLGLTRYLKNAGFADAYVSQSTSPSWNSVKNSLVTDRPNVTSFKGSTYYGAHSVTGVGTVEYSYNGSSAGHQYMIVHDNRETTPTDVYIAYGRNYSTLYVCSIYKAYYYAHTNKQITQS